MLLSFGRCFNYLYCFVAEVMIEIVRVVDESIRPAGLELIPTVQPAYPSWTIVIVLTCLLSQIVRHHSASLRTSSCELRVMEDVPYSRPATSNRERASTQVKHHSPMLSTRTTEKKYAPSVSHTLRAITHRLPSEHLVPGASNGVEPAQQVLGSAAMSARRAGNATRLHRY